MSQQQPQRPQAGKAKADLFKYGDVFPSVQGELAREPIKPQDAAMMQSAENLVMGQTQKGGPAAVMQSASTKNRQAGLVGQGDVSDVPVDRGVTVTETDLPGQRIITEAVAGQVVGQYTMPPPVSATAPEAAPVTVKITIGEALDAAAMTAGDKPIEQSDAAAIQVAEIRATGIDENIPGGIAASAQVAASANARVMRDEDKTKLGDVLADATTKLSADKVVTRDEAERVIAAELRNNPNMATTPGGVAASVMAAARINQEKQL